MIKCLVVSALDVLLLCCKFLPNMSIVLAPLYQLLLKCVPWTGNTDSEKPLPEPSHQILFWSIFILMKIYIILACDAHNYPYGVEALLSHGFNDGSTNQLHLLHIPLLQKKSIFWFIWIKALAIIFEVKHFHQYATGQHFTILSDHKPLQLLLAAKGVPTLASAGDH